MILFTAEKAKFTSANTAVANGTACYSEVPSTMDKIKYVLTFTDHNINVKTYGSDPYRYSYNVNFTSTNDRLVDESAALRPLITCFFS